MSGRLESPQRSPGQKRRKAPVQDTQTESTVAAQRLVDYFVVISSRPRWNSQQQADPVAVAESRQGSSERTEGNIHMPQPRSDYTFQPQITARYPEDDYGDNPLNPMILQFCYPSDDVIVPSKTYQLPQVHHFVLTNERGHKVYGTCLTIFEECTAEGPWKSQAMTLEDDNAIELSVDQSGKALYIPKVLCLLSSWPYLTAFREYLAQLYRLATATNVMGAPIERYVVNICKEIPAPPPGAYEVQVSILDSTIRFWAPPAKLPIAYVGLPYKILFECLEVDNILALWSGMIVERKILLVSSQYSILTVCAEILCSLLFPMRWSHLYVPLLPKMFCPMLDAPVPYLCGIVRENWLHAQQHLSKDAIVVDLDNGTVKFGPTVPEIPTPPLRKWNKLHTILTELIGIDYWRARGMEKEYQHFNALAPHKRPGKFRQSWKGKSQWKEKLSSLDHAFNLAYTPDSPNLLNDRLSETEQAKWANVQDAFLQFFVSALKDYRKFLIQVDASVPNSRPSFDLEGFLVQRKAGSPFMTEMCMTQQFDDFLTRRMYSPGEPDLIFFDQSIDAKKNRSKLKIKKVDTPFLQSANAHKVLTKFPAVAPNIAGLATALSFVYKKWPSSFDRNLFSTPRAIPKMIASEFDRQAYLVSKLRPNINLDESDGDPNIMEFYGGDFEMSPEVAAFTVYFFVYSAIVGKDWETFSQQRRQEMKVAHARCPTDTSGEDNREGVDDCVETVLPNESISKRARAGNSCISDLSLGVCETCPDQTVLSLRSTLIYIGQEAEESYKSFFQKTVEQVDAWHDNETDHDQKTMHTHASEEAVAVYEEARAVAVAQLDLAFEALTTVSLRGLSADSDSYLSLMEACGRCGDRRRALELIELMKKDGFVADSKVLASFVAAFSRNDEDGTITSSNGTDSDSDAYSRFLKKQIDSIQAQQIHQTDTAHPTTSDGSEARAGSDEASQCSDCSTNTPTGGGTAFLDWFAYNRPARVEKRGKRRRRRKKKTVAPNMPVTGMLQRQILLGESLLDYIYPDLSIETSSDSCPRCSYVLSEGDVVQGWIGCAFQDYTTECSQCDYRFVPQFIVSSSSTDFEGSQGRGTPLYCEFLSPWVLRKELQGIIKGDTGIDGMLKPEWREGTGLSATLFWNLVVLFRRNRLPYAFLLQGSFQNRLILPHKPDEI